MAPSERDRRVLAAQARDLDKLTSDDAPTAHTQRRSIDDANRDRHAGGRPDLDENREPPETEFYRRARDLGLRRISR